MLSSQDSMYIDRLRGASILRVVLGHLGLGWIFLPYSSYIGVFLSVLFYCSGYISYHIYVSSEKTAKIFLVRRVMNVLVPFYVVYIFAVLMSVLWSGNTDSINFGHAVRLLLVAPTYTEMPFPLGQIWFLRVLIFCLLVSPVVFFFARRSSYFLLVPTAIAIIFSAIQTVYPFSGLINFKLHNFYQSIVYGGFFFIGSFVYTKSWRDAKVIIFILAFVSVLLGVLSLIIQDGSVKFSDHAYSPDLFYVMLGISGILITLFLHSIIEWFLDKAWVLDRLLNFCAKHSYGIYLNHSFFIIFYEVTFGLKNVIENLWLAALKVVLVVASSMIFAIPITYISRAIIKKLRNWMTFKGESVKTRGIN